MQIKSCSFFVELSNFFTFYYPFVPYIIYIVMKYFGTDGIRGEILKEINAKLLNKVAKAEENISTEAGVISIYGERWEARNVNEDVIPAGAEVKIIRNESLIMFVEKA